MRKGIAIAALAAAVTTAALGAAATLGPGDGTASSHREAPLIADDPAADITDVYAFRSPDRPNTVTVLANVIPGEDPAAGPNWYTFSPTARYNLKVDTTGDVQAGRRSTGSSSSGRPGPFFLGDTAQPYTVTRIAKGQDDGRGPRDDAAEQHRPALDPELPGPRREVDRSFDGGASKAFAGQRDDPFFGDIGAIFDLVAIRKGTGNMGGGKDFFAGYGVHTFGVQIPIAGSTAKNGGDRRLGVRRPAEGHDPRLHDARRGALGPGQPARQSARQRGDHPDRPQGPLERTAAVERVGVQQVLRGRRSSPR